MSLVVIPTLHKDQCLISAISWWSRSDVTVCRDEFLEIIKASKRIGHWSGNDQREIEILSLTGSANLYYQGYAELHEVAQNGKCFKDEFRQGTNTSIWTGTNLLSCKRRISPGKKDLRNLRIVVRDKPREIYS